MDNKEPKLLGSFLVQKHLVKPLDVLHALDKQKEMHIPIGRIAIDREILDVKSVLKILDYQSEQEPSLSFGQIGVKLGYLTEKQIEELLDIQRNSVKPIGEILIDMGCLNKDDLKEALKDFEKEHYE